MNEKTAGMGSLIHAGVIKDQLAEIRKVSSCLAEQSQAIRTYFLGESPNVQKQIESEKSAKGGVGYFYDIRNGLDDVHALLEEAMDNLIVFGHEIGIDRSTISECPKRRE